MKFNNVQIGNFLGIGEAHFALDDRGLNLIQGVNEDDPSADSNGSGKSSMIDAIFWCIYGSTARGLTGDDVVNHVTGKNCVVTVRIVDGEDEAIIERWRKAKGFHKPSGVSIKINGVDKTGGTDQLTQALIDNFMGASQEVFAAAVYAGQESMPDIPSMSDRQLKSLIEEAAGITTIEKAYEEARVRVNERKAEQMEAERKFGNSSDKLAEAEDNEFGLKKRHTEWGASMAKRIEDAKAAVQAKIKEAKDYAAEIEKLDPEKIKADIETQEKKVAKIKSDIAAIDDKIAAAGSENDKRQELQQVFSTATAEASSQRRQATRTIDEYKRIETEIANIDRKLGTKCGECGKPITEDDLADTLRALQTKLAAAKVAAKTEKAQYDALTKKADDASAVLADYINGMTDTSEEVTRKRNLQSVLGPVESHARKLTEQLGSITGMRARLEALKVSARTENDKAKELAAAANPYTDLLKEAAEKTKLARERRKELEDAYHAASKRVLLAQAAAEVFGPKGVRAQILDTVTPFLNDRTAHYLGALSDGSLEAVWTTLTESKAGELKEKFSIATAKYGSGSFKSLSGGEKRKVRLATMLALQDLVASRASKPIELWVGDEIDDALDTAGLERLMTLLETKAREKGTVLIVSHNDLADWCRDIVTVRMKGKLATVEGSICLSL